MLLRPPAHPLAFLVQAAKRSIAMSTLVRPLISTLMGVLLVGVGATRATASTISLGTRITISPTTFAVPVEITDAVEVSSWEVALTYDPADVQVNVTCDPFSGDVYCALPAGYVTDGDFFAAGAPFNVLTSGIVNLNPITFAQTGLLFAVDGIYAGASPAPSGDGVLAFVEFTQLGNGNSPISVTGAAVSDVPISNTPVPEPGTLTLIATGLLLPRVRRAIRRARRS
jgi:hypothetical protein